MKKYIKVLLAVLMIACLALTVVACNDPCKDGHDWDEGTVTKAANCTEKGVKTFKCKNCDETKTEEIAIDATNHKGPEVAIDPVEAGCETDGSKDGKKCSACGVTTVAPTTVPAAHKFNATTHKCDVCQKIDPAYAVAQVGEVDYLTLAEAIAAGSEVKLLKNVEVTACLTVAKELTIVLNGHDLTVPATAEGNIVDMFLIDTNGKLTVTGDGNVTNNKSEGYIFYAQGTGELVIEGGTYYTVDCTIVQVRNNAKAYIRGGNFSVKGEDQYGTTYMLNKIDADRATAVIDVTGGTFKNFDPSKNAAEGADTNFVKAGCKVTSKTEGDDTLYSVALGSSFETTAFGDVKVEAGKKYFVVGIVDAITKMDYNSSITLRDNNGKTIVVYGVLNEDGTVRYGDAKDGRVLLTSVFNVGDIVTFYGATSEYGGAVQISNGWLVELNGVARITVDGLYLAGVSVPSEVLGDFDLQSGDGLTWTVKSGTGIVITDNKAVVTRTTEDQTVVLTAHYGEATKDFTVRLPADIPGLELNVTVTTAGFNSTSYASNNGDHKIGDYTVNTNQIYRKSGTDNMQWQKSNAKMTVTGTFTKIVIKTGESNQGTFTLTIDGTVFAATSNADGVITFDFGEAKTGEFVISETGGKTGVVSAVEYWNLVA